MNPTANITDAVVITILTKRRRMSSRAIRKASEKGSVILPISICDADMVSPDFMLRVSKQAFKCLLRL